MEEPGWRVTSTVILESGLDVVVDLVVVGLSWQLSNSLLYTVCCRKVLIIDGTCK